MVLESLVSALIVIGGFFALIGALGLIRLRGFFARLHAPTKASTLGLGGVLLAALLAPTLHGGFPGLYEMLLTLFVFVTAPVSAQMLSHAAYQLQLDRPDAGHEDLEDAK